MQSSQFHTLRAVCKRYGPGRLPNADRNDIGAGYAAAAAAVVATLLYGVLISVRGVLASGIEEVYAMVFFSLALPFVVPAAFIVGILGWRLLPSYSTPVGVIGGGLGALTSYFVASLLFGAFFSVAAALSLTGADPAGYGRFSIALGTVAAILTWWVTIPIGCLAGYVYVNVVKSSTCTDRALSSTD